MQVIVSNLKNNAIKLGEKVGRQKIRWQKGRW